MQYMQFRQKHKCHFIIHLQRHKYFKMNELFNLQTKAGWNAADRLNCTFIKLRETLSVKNMLFSRCFICFYLYVHTVCILVHMCVYTCVCLYTLACIYSSLPLAFNIFHFLKWSSLSWFSILYFHNLKKISLIIQIFIFRLKLFIVIYQN